MRSLTLVARAYIVFVWIVAVAILLSIPFVEVDYATVAVLAVAYLVAGHAASVGLESSISVNVGPAIALAGVLLLPPSAAALVVVPIIFVNPPKRRRSWVQRLFNGAMHACSAAAAGFVYHVAGGERILGDNAFAYIPQAVLAELAYCVVNGLLLAGVIRASEGTPLLSVWRSVLSSTIVQYLGYGLVGIVIAALWRSDGGMITALLVVLPLYIARWTFALYTQEQEAYSATVGALVQAIDTKDHYTRGHSERVGLASTMIARKLGLAEDRRQALYFAGILHDVGKLGVPSRVLKKSGALTEDEYEAIKLHPMHGMELVRGIGFLREAYNGILHHHERVDGRGYPLGLAGDEIPEFARIIAVADAFDCMTSTRSYRGARSVEEAVAELRRCAGAQFDPRIVEALAVAVADEVWESQVVAPPPIEAASAVSSYDHDDPTIQIPVVKADGSPADTTPDRARETR